jgi:hypothetical protein
MLPKGDYRVVQDAMRFEVAFAAIRLIFYLIGV